MGVGGCRFVTLQSMICMVINFICSRELIAKNMLQSQAQPSRGKKE